MNLEVAVLSDLPYIIVAPLRRFYIFGQLFTDTRLRSGMFDLDIGIWIKIIALVAVACVAFLGCLIKHWYVRKVRNLDDKITSEIEKKEALIGQLKNSD